MTEKSRWELAAAVVLPLVTLTVYLLWIWPRPRGTSMLADMAPYGLSLLVGLPFAWRLGGPTRRVWFVPVYVVGGFVGLYFYAITILCGVRGVCL